MAMTTRNIRPAGAVFKNGATAEEMDKAEMLCEACETSTPFVYLNYENKQVWIGRARRLIAFEAKAKKRRRF
jgi:hypothetical protein